MPAGRCVAALIASMALAGCALAPAEDVEESWRPDVLVRSDTPLWTENSGAAVSPRPFSSNDDFGCASEFPFGDWRQTFTPDEEGDRPDPVWWRNHNYGAFHCGAIFARGEERGAPGAESEVGFFIRLGHDTASGLDLFAWQLGMRTGSTYLLLSAQPGSDLSAFNVLAPDCARGELRKAASTSSWITEYCAVNSQSALVATARTAVKRPPLGRLQYVANVAPNRAED